MSRNAVDVLEETARLPELFGPEHWPCVRERLVNVILAEKPAALTMQDFAVTSMFQAIVIRLIEREDFRGARRVLAQALGLPEDEGAPLLPPVNVANVYFVQAGPGGPIKIGLARDVSKRMDTLQNGCAEPLTLLLAIPGDRDTELRLHGEFAAHRLQREWFSPAPEILRRIEEIRSHGMGG